jgi:hypothetical protein
MIYERLIIINNEIGELYHLISSLSFVILRYKDKHKLSLLDSNVHEENRNSQ